MGRLIDADKLIILAENTFARPSGFIQLIKETETAYNVDAVVAELEKAISHFQDNGDMRYGLQIAIDIVKAGGVE